MTVSATDVPNKFDCIINGEGYLFAPSDAGLPPSVFGVKPEFSYTPTFLTRQNTQGDYGDNQQDFWLTATQRDWSLGEQQKYFRPGDDDSKRRYWAGTNVSPTEAPGQVSMRGLVAVTSAFGGAIREVVASSNANKIFGASTTNLYEINSAGTVTDRGAHGVGALPLGMSMGGSVSDVFMSASGQKVRHWNGAAFSDFAASPNGSDRIAYLNNALYGISILANSFVRYDTAGTPTAIYDWKDVTGGSTGVRSELLAFGGKLLILRSYEGEGSSLYLYDGVAPTLIYRLPGGFIGQRLALVAGTVLISGNTFKRLSAGTYVKPTIYYYANGTTGKLWEANSFISSASADENYNPAMVEFFGGLVFQDDTTGSLMFYDPAKGGVHTIGSYTVQTGQDRMAACKEFMLLAQNTTTPYRFPSDGFSTTATVTSSLFDFDSSLNKLIRGIKVEFDSATDGNGGTVDISYRTGDVDGSYTSLQTGATSGTEYTLSGVTGRSISVKVTLNKGTSTAGPVLKRVSVRAAPQQTTFRQGKYVLFLGGASKRDPLEGQMLSLRDGTRHRKDGAAMAANIITAATSATPISVTDGPNGTVSSVVCDLANFQLAQIKPGEYVCVFPWREV